MATLIVFFVPAPSGVFGRAAHPPTDVRQTTASLSQAFRVVGNGVDVCFFGLGRITRFRALSGE